MLANFQQLFLDARDAVLHPATIGFKLGFTVTAHADAALLSGQVTPEPCQARQEMLQLRELNLELAFASPGALSKDVENQRGPIQHLALENFFEIAALGGRQIVIEDHRVHVVLLALRCEFIRLAAADERAGHRGIQLLRPATDDLAARRGRQLLQLGHGILQVPSSAGLELKADEEDSLRRFPKCRD